MKTLSDLQEDACMLAGLIDGLDACWASGEQGALNAMVPMLNNAKQIADQINSDLDMVNRDKLDLQEAGVKLEAATKKGGRLNTHEDIASSLYKIAALCRVGTAASDTTIAVKVRGDEHQAVYDMIAELATKAIETAETPQTVA